MIRDSYILTEMFCAVYTPIRRWVVFLENDMVGKPKRPRKESGAYIEYIHPLTSTCIMAEEGHHCTYKGLIVKINNDRVSQQWGERPKTIVTVLVKLC